MEGMFEEKLDQAEKIFPQYSWKYAPAQLDELLQNGEKTKVSFEKGGGQGLTIDQFGYKDHIQC